MEKIFYFVYITTNLKNGRQYVGDHSTNNLDDGYLGSGTNLFKAIAKYGRHNFNKQILEFCSSKEEAFNLQEKYINQYNTLSPNGYNISPKGGHNVKGCISEETKQKIGKANKGKQPWLGRNHSEESKEKISKNGKGRIPWNKGKRGVSEETRQKMSDAHSNQIPWNKGLTMKEETRKKLQKPKSETAKQNMRKPKSEKGKQNIKAAHNTASYFEKMSKIHKGKKCSEETRKKMSEAAKKRQYSEETRKKMSDAQKKRFRNNTSE